MVFVVNVKREDSTDLELMESLLKDLPLTPHPEFGIHHVIKGVANQQPY